MKKIILLAAIALAIPLQGCDGIFDPVEPRTSISSELALTSIEGFEALLVSVYDRLQRVERYGQFFMLYPDGLADNITHTVPHSNRYPAVVNNNNRTHMNEWTAPYLAINESNYIIHWIDRLDPDDIIGTDPLGRIRRVKGQAYFLRALNYFDLVRTKSYEPGMEVNGWTHGVILRTDPVDNIDQANFRERASNAAVYAQVESDLLEAITLLADAEDGTENHFASRPAALALLARVYLYQRKWQEAASAATDALNATTRSLVVDTGTQYAASWAAERHPEAIFELRMTPGRDGASTNSNGALHALTWGEEDRQQFSFEVIPTEDLLNAHEDDDARLDLYADGVKPRPVGAPVQVVYSQKWRDNAGTMTSNIPIIRVPELYLIRAEARAESGDAPGAHADINAVRNARRLADVDPGLAGAALIDAIYLERRLEFAFEGHRFFDLKRRGMTIPKPQVATSDILYDDHRIIAPLPTDEVIFNPLLVQNPGY